MMMKFMEKYDGQTFEDIHQKSKIIYEEINKYDEPILGIDQFLLIIDAINGLIRTGETLDFDDLKKLRDKYASTLNELLKELLDLKRK